MVGACQSKARRGLFLPADIPKINSSDPVIQKKRLIILWNLTFSDVICLSNVLVSGLFLLGEFGSLQILAF